MVKIKAKLDNQREARPATFWVVAVLILACIGAAGTAAATAAAAHMGTPAPTCPPPYVFSGKKAACVPCPQGSQYDTTSKTCTSATPAVPQKCTTNTDANGVKTTVCVTGVQASASDIDTGNVTVLGYIQANGMPRAVVKKLTAQGKCFWVGRGTKYPVFTNSGARSGYGPYGKFKDTRRTFVCRTGKGPSGIQKVYDINPVTHQKEHYCDNYIWLKLLKNLIQGQVLVVRNLANVHMHLHAEAHVTAASPNCPGTTAEGSGQADITITLSEYMRSHGDVTSQLSASAYGKATANAKASVVCAPGTTTVVTTTTPAPPPTTTTTTTTTTPTPVSYSAVFDTINDIPAGSCRPETLHVNTSVSGQEKIYPNVGKISTVDCYQPNTGQLSTVTVPVNAGATDISVYVYEPTDTSATSDTLTAAPLINGLDTKNNTVTTSFAISHSTRP